MRSRAWSAWPAARPPQPVAPTPSSAERRTRTPAAARTIPGDCTSVTLWDGAFQRVVQFFGHGSVANLPVEVQDRRFFWKMYTTALLKYLEVADNLQATAEDVDNVVLQANDLFFDSVGTGQYETAEYVDRRFVNGRQPARRTSRSRPTSSTASSTTTAFDRVFLRGETMLYSAVQCTDTTPGACAPGDHRRPAARPGREPSAADQHLRQPASSRPPIRTSRSPTAPVVTGYHCATTDSTPRSAARSRVASFRPMSATA